MSCTFRGRLHYEAIATVACASWGEVKWPGRIWMGVLAVALLLVSAISGAAAFDPCDNYAGPVFSSAAVRAGELPAGDYILWCAEGIFHEGSDSCDTWSWQQIGPYTLDAGRKYLVSNNPIRIEPRPQIGGAISPLNPNAIIYHENHAGPDYGFAYAFERSIVAQQIGTPPITEATSIKGRHAEYGQSVTYQQNLPENMPTTEDTTSKGRHAEYGQSVADQQINVLESMLSASSVYDGYTPVKSFDHDFSQNSGWCAEGGQKTGWIVVDFGTAKELTKVRVIPDRYIAADPSYSYLDRFRVDIWKNGAWLPMSPLISTPEAMGLETWHEVPLKVMTDKVRIWAESDGNGPQIKEIEIYEKI
jgi:hypothetical protein